MPIARTAAALLLLSLLGGCATFDQLASIGETPKLTPISNPTAQPGYQPVSMPMPPPEQAYYEPNSLFSNNATGFFKDQRAHRIGDILLVEVEIADKAKIAEARIAYGGRGQITNVQQPRYGEQVMDAILPF